MTRLWLKCSVLALVLCAMPKHHVSAKGKFEFHQPKTWARDTLTEQIRIPLIRRGNLFFIEAQINDETGKFIFDLGAPGLVLNSTYFRDYDTDETMQSGSMLGLNASVRSTEVDSFRMAQLCYRYIQADVTDLGAIENQRQVKILGLIGVSLFKGYVLEIDFRAAQLTLTKTWDQTQEDGRLIFTTPIETFGNKLTLSSLHGKHKLKLLLDTGAEMNVLDKDLPESIFEGMKIQRTQKLLDSQGGSAEAVVASVGGYTIGDRKFRKMKTMIIDLRSMSKAYGLPIDGMLGFPFFSSGRVLIDLRKKELFMYQFEYRP